MGVENKEELEKKLHDKLMNEMGDESGAVDHIRQSLENISYRYFDIEESLPGSKLVNIGSDNACVIEAKQTNLASALKTSHKETRSQVIELAKSFSKKDAPAPLYRIGVILKNVDNRGGGEFVIFSEVNCDFPEYREDTQKSVTESRTLKYDDFIELRNNIAREIDDICQIF